MQNNNKKNILVIDDVLSNIKLVQEVLSEQYNISACIDPLKGFDIIKKTTPDLILLDINMPQMNGFEFSQKLHDTDNANIPIVFLSSLNDKESIEKGLSIGAYDYITKPFEKDELINSVNMHMNINRKINHLFMKNSFENISLLVVEDNSEIYQKFNEYLESVFEKIFYATSYTSAYEIAVTYKPQIILMDYHIHNINTFDLARKINIIDNNIIITQMSEVLNPDLMLDFIRNGARDILKKPISWIDFKSALLRYEKILNKDKIKEIKFKHYTSIHNIRELFFSLLENNNGKITLINNYKGIPVIKDCEIVEIMAKEVLIRMDDHLLKIIELLGSTVLSSVYFTKDIQVKLKYINHEKSMAAFDNFVFLDTSIQNRKNIRIEPDNTFFMYLIFEGKAKRCHIINISNNYALIVLKEFTDDLEHNTNVEIDVRFALLDTSRTKLSKRQEMKSKKAFVNKFTRYNNQVELLIYFEFSEEKQLIFNKYVYQRAIELIMECKKQMNEGDKH